MIRNGKLIKYVMVTSGSGAGKHVNKELSVIFCDYKDIQCKNGLNIDQVRCYEHSYYDTTRKKKTSVMSESCFLIFLPEQ